MQLTPRELQVLTLISEGKCSKEVAYQLGMSFRTACCHRWRILRKFEVHNTAEMIRKAIESGVVKVAPTGVAPPSHGAPNQTRREPLLARLGVAIEETLRYREALYTSLTSSQAVFKRAEDNGEQLRATVLETRRLCAALKAAGSERATAA